MIEKLPRLTVVKGVRNFLRHASFYQRFIKDFSKILKPDTLLLIKDVHFDFSEKCLNAFYRLKGPLILALIIQAMDWELPF